MRIVSTITAGLLLFAGCGGEAETTEPVELSSGGDESPPPELHDDVQDLEDAEPAPTGPGHLRIEARLGTEPFTEAVELRNAEGEVVATVRDGQELDLPAGVYVLHGEIRDEDQLIDKPSRDGEVVELPAGGEATAEIVFRRSRVRITATRNGRNLPQARITLRRQGESEPVAEFPSDGRTLSVTPGRYEATIRHRDHHVDANGLVFQDGATQNIPIELP
jgi:hypothetical protein